MNNFKQDPVTQEELIYAIKWAVMQFCVSEDPEIPGRKIFGYIPRDNRYNYIEFWKVLEKLAITSTLIGHIGIDLDKLYGDIDEYERKYIMLKEIIKELERRHPVQKAHYEDDLGKSLKEFGAVEVDSGIDVDKHRLYETSIVVFKIITSREDLYLGVHCVTDLFSEMSSWGDILWHYEFFEMDKVVSTSFAIREKT